MVIQPDGSRVIVARFHAGRFRLNLHIGGQDPPVANAMVPVDGGQAVSPSEQPRLLAAFNGGFKVSTGSGGFEIDHEVLSPLVAGDASVVIDAGGVPTLGAWGQTVPRAGAQVASVRQNLGPLVDDGRLAPSVDQVTAWGLTVAGGRTVARSALGQDAAGDLLFAGSSSALPIDLAQALVATGARFAMELDINQDWVQLDLASVPGGPLTAAIPGQTLPAGRYLEGWTRDFFTVLSAP